MSELLLHWLNNDLQLSVFVSEVETDFSSGYLFGELLYRLNQQHNFTDFMNSAIADAKIINFCLLEPTIRRLNIKFDSKIATAIMNGKRGAATNVLYQIKMAAERVARVPGISTKPLERRNIQPSHNIPSKLAKPSFDSAHHYFFEHSVRRQVKSLSELRQEREAIETDKRRMIQHREEQGRIQQQLEVIKAERLHQAFIHTQYIKTALDETYSPAWRLALGKKSEREHRRAAFYHQLLTEKNRKEQLNTLSLRQTVERDLGDFERCGSSASEGKTRKGGLVKVKYSHGYGLRSLCTTLENQRSQQDSGLRDPSKPISVGETTPDQLNNSALIRDQKQRRERWTDQFGRRRKRFLLDALHCQSHANISRLFQDLETVVHRMTHCEGEFKQASEKILIYKNIARENRLRREENYASRRDLDLHEAIDRDTAMFELLFAKYNDDWEAQALQKNQRLGARTAAHQHENQLIAGLVLHEIISFAMVVAAHREATMHSRDSGSFLQTAEKWDELKFQFSARGPYAVDADGEENMLLENQFLQYLQRFCDPSMIVTDYVGVVTKGSKMSPWAPANWKFIGADEILEDRFVLGETVKYLRWLSYANPPLQQPSRNESAAKALNFESETENRQISVEFADVSQIEQSAGEAVIEALGQNPQLSPAQSNTDLHPARPRLRMLLLGPPFAGKSTQARLLAQKYDLSLLSVERLLLEAITNKTSVGKEVHELLSQGLEIPPRLYSQLVLEEIARPDNNREDRWVLYDLPSTQKHAQNLEEHLTNYIDPSAAPSPFDHESVIAPGCEKPRLPRSFYHGKSGVDVVFYLDCAESSVLERCLGTLEDYETRELSHHLLFEQPPIDAVYRHRLHHVNRTSNVSELLSLQFLTTLDASHDSKRWFAKFDTLREIATTEWQHGESVSITRSLTQEATHRKLVELIEAFCDQRRGQDEASEREKELSEERMMQNEENRQWKLSELKRAIAQAQDYVSTAQLAVQQAEEAKAKKEEVVELKNAVEVAKKAHESALIEARDWRFDEILQIHKANTVYSERLEPSLASVLACMWDAMETEYTITMKQCLRMQREQRERVETRIAWLVDTMSRLVRRVDNKQAIVDTFQSQLNDVIDEMRLDDATKSELHARVDVLQEDLCLDTFTKRRENENELSKIMADGWLEDAWQWCALIYQRALQAECDRFRTSLQILIDTFLAASDEPAQLAGIAEQLMMNQQLLAELTLKTFADSSDEPEPPNAPLAATAPTGATSTKGGTAKRGAPAAKAKPPLVATPTAAAPTVPDTSADSLAPEKLLHSFDMVIERGDLILQLIVNAQPKREETVAKSAEPAGAPPPPHSKTSGKTGNTPAATPSATPVSSTVLLPRQSIDVATSNFLKAAKYEHKLLGRRVRYLKDAVQSASDQMARALRSVESKIREVIEDRSIREEAATASLLAHVRAAIEAETNLPFYINIQPEQVYRFPPTQQLLGDTLVNVETWTRLLARPSVDVEPEIEANHAIVLNERQFTALAARLAHVHTRPKGEPSPLTTLQVVEVLRMLQHEPHGMPKLWQVASEEVLTQVVASFADEDAGTVNTSALMEALRTDESILTSHLQQRRSS